jgi:hypothetical protein
MALKLCEKHGHLTGTRACARCESPTIAVKGPRGRMRVPKKEKKAITQAIRDRGQVPVKDLKTGS